jgi:hypothetical protein
LHRRTDWQSPQPNDCRICPWRSLRRRRAITSHYGWRIFFLLSPHLPSLFLFCPVRVRCGYLPPRGGGKERRWGWYPFSDTRIPPPPFRVRILVQKFRLNQNCPVRVNFGTRPAKPKKAGKLRQILSIAAYREADREVVKHVLDSFEANCQGNTHSFSRFG